MKFIKILLFTLFSLSVPAQNQFWKTYFSYAEITAVTAGGEEVFATTTNAILIFNTQTESVEVVSSVQGLQLQRVSALHYSEKFKKVIIGNEDGSIQIVDRRSGKISYVNDILNKNSLPPTIKRVNSFTEYKGNLYIATNYGISVLNLNNNQFLDTYYIGNRGEFQKVFQVAVLNNWIYAATETQGLKRATVSNPNLVDYNQWNIFNSETWNGIVAFDNKLVGVKEDFFIYEFTLSGLETRGNVNEVLNKLHVCGSFLVATSASRALVYNSQMNIIGNIPKQGISDGVFFKNYLYLGTAKEGLLQHDLSNANNPVALSPQGPLSNRTFSLTQTDRGLWMVFGGYDRMYNPHEPELSAYGLSLYSLEKGWESIPYDKLHNARALSKATLNPRNKQQLFVSSFHSGLLKIDLDEEELGRSEVVLYDSENTGNQGLEKIDPNSSGVPTGYISVRINGAAFDAEGNAWMTNSLVKNNLKERLINGEWRSYSFSNRILNTENSNFGVPVIDRNDTKWLPSLDDGLIGFNEKRGDKIIVLNTGTSTGNLPDMDVMSLAIDHNNQLWIGTYRGLRILPNVDQFLSNAQLNTNSIIIKQDGLAEELFYQQSITKIKVDGANNKWVALADAGVFLISPDGQETIYHFTKENSPLPNNNINDIEINGKTGEVFFATDSGVVSFKGDATEASNSYAEVFVYPNPVRPEYQGTVKISGLLDKSNVKIADVEGNLVFESTSKGGTVIWDTYSFSGRKVKSGVYLIFVSSQDASEKIVKKIMIIR